MKTKLLLIFVLSSTFSFGQISKSDLPTARNSIFLEVFGQGIINSINYERSFNLDHKLINTSTIGFTYMELNNEAMYGIPISFNFISGKKDNHLEFGLGFSYIVDNSKKIHVTEIYPIVDPLSGQEINYTHSFIGSQADHYIYFTPKLGYRYQKNGSGFLFRATFTPALAILTRTKALKGSNLEQSDEPARYFSWEDAIINSPVLPWAGISFGYSF